MNVRKELMHAEAMLERRRAVLSSLGSESSSGDAVNVFCSMLTCLKEVQKHRDNVFSVVDDSTAGVALDMSMLLDEVKRWVLAAEDNALAWGVSRAECDAMRSQVLTYVSFEDIIDNEKEGL
jgi:hypothetical protein